MSLTDWSLDPSLAYVTVAAALYWRGGRERAGRAEPLRAAAFVAGLLSIVVALDSPLEGYADRLFWVHMLQHVLLLTVAPPLILLGRPWPRMWRALPLGARTVVGRALARGRWSGPLRALARPVPAFILFNGSIAAWHVPVAYDATLSSGALHAAEHAVFFFCGLLFWARVINPGPLRPRLVWPVRVGYVVGAMTVGWILAVTLVTVPHALYGHYAALANRPGGIDAVTDQQLAAGVMWVPGSFAYAVTVLVGFYRWLEPDRSTSSRPATLTT